MAFSLSNWFKGKPGAPGSENPDETPSEPAAPAAPAASPPPPAAVRTVVPNSVQPVSLRTPGSIGGPRPGPAPLPVSSPPPAPAAAVGRVSPVIPAARGKISFGGAPAAPEAAAPAAAPVPAPAPAAIADVTVSLEVGDFLDRLPPSFVQAGAVDRRRRVDFRASELYSDMTKGRASVPASVIYQKCPELFSRPVTDEEDTEIALPLQKLVEQMSQAFQTRADQMAEENVGEIETPFLQVAMEDSARLPKAAGTTAGALRPAQSLAPAASPLNEPPHRPHRTGQISTISPLKTAPEPAPMQAAPTAQTAAPINAAKRPPSTVRASVAGGKIRLSGPSMPSRMVPVAVPPPAVPAAEAPAVELPPSASQRILPPLQVPNGQAASPSLQVSKKTARIQIPPISLRGPGAPTRPSAPAAVPVQSSPVPVRPGPSAEPAAPPITFHSAPPPGTRKMPHTFAPPPVRSAVPPLSFASAPAPAAPPAPAADDRKIHLSLAAILRGLPLSALTVEPNTVPDDVRVTLPFALVEPQLAQGRVVIPQATFAGALPESHRDVLASNSGLSEVPLPLQEVFQNLPPAALAIRQDQVVEEIGHAYPTPFSQKADEDAQRFGSPAAGEAPAAAQVAAPEPVAPAAPPAPEISVDRPLPVEDVAPEAAVVDPPAPEDETGEDAPGEEFANLFVEESVPARDIPLDFGGDKPADVAEPVVEARAPVEEKPEPAAPGEARPEAADAGSRLAPPAPEEPELEAAREEKPAETAEPKPGAPAGEKPGDQPASALEAKHEEPAAEREETPRPAEPAPAAKGMNGHAPEPAAPVRPAPAPAVNLQDSVLQSLFMTEDELDAKSIVRLVSALPGLEGCTVMFEDGLQLAGNFPAESDTEGFSAMAPPFFKRSRNFTGEINLGALHALTLHTERGLVSFFMHEHICLSVRHSSGRGFLPGVREKLEAVTRELARMYATAAA